MGIPAVALIKEALGLSREEAKDRFKQYREHNKGISEQFPLLKPVQGQSQLCATSVDAVQALLKHFQDQGAVTMHASLHEHAMMLTCALHAAGASATFWAQHEAAIRGWLSEPAAGSTGAEGRDRTAEASTSSANSREPITMPVMVVNSGLIKGPLWVPGTNIIFGTCCDYDDLKELLALLGDCQQMEWVMHKNTPNAAGTLVARVYHCTFGGRKGRHIQQLSQRPSYQQRSVKVGCTAQVTAYIDADYALNIYGKEQADSDSGSDSSDELGEPTPAPPPAPSSSTQQPQPLFSRSISVRIRLPHTMHPPGAELALRTHPKVAQFIMSEARAGCQFKSIQNKLDGFVQQLLAELGLRPHVHPLINRRFYPLVTGLHQHSSDTAQLATSMHDASSVK